MQHIQVAICRLLVSLYKESSNLVTLIMFVAEG
jgi:hypothetical protein